MRNLTRIALAILMVLGCSRLGAQTSGMTPESSSTVSTASSNLPDDPAFAQFQRVTKGIKPPKATHAPDPKFPQLPAYAEPHGTVVMLVGVGAKGRVEAVRVLRSDEPAFEQSAVDTVKKWKFKPAQKNGAAIPVQVTVEMKFQR